MLTPISVTRLCGEITPQEFVTDFNRRVFECLSDKIQASVDYSVSTLNAEFSPDEMGKIVGILTHFEQLGVDDTVCKDYIRVLKSYNRSLSQQDATSSNENFMKALNQMRTDAQAKQ